MSDLGLLSSASEEASSDGLDSESDLVSDTSGEEGTPMSDSDSGGSLVPYSFDPGYSSSAGASTDSESSDNDEERLSSLTWYVLKAATG